MRAILQALKQMLSPESGFCQMTKLASALPRYTMEVVLSINPFSLAASFLLNAAIDFKSSNPWLLLSTVVSPYSNCIGFQEN